MVEGAIEVGPLSEAIQRRLESTAPSTAQWREAFDVRVEGAPTSVLGRYSLRRNALRFEPRYRLQAGLTYEVHVQFDRLAQVDMPSNLPTLHARLEIPKSRAGEAPRVERLDPSSEILPENLLRFYIQFSQPMSRGDAYARIELRDEHGKRIERPFLELGEELWDPSMTRFTLLLDPGRIKRGLVPREELGPILEAGKRYELAVIAGWRDADGVPTVTDFRMPFRAIEEDVQPPDPAQWIIEPPAPGTRDGLRIAFEAPVDRALAERLITVRDPDSDSVSGTAAVDRTGRFWTFVPTENWNPGTHQVLVGTDLEDLVGNRVGQRFEVDVFDVIEPRVESKAVSVPFDVGP